MVEPDLVARIWLTMTCIKKCFNLDLANDQTKCKQNAITPVMQQMDFQSTISGTRRGNDQ